MTEIKNLMIKEGDKNIKFFHHLVIREITLLPNYPMRSGLGTLRIRFGIVLLILGGLLCQVTLLI